jgi:ATP-dependent RNA helicase RhlE
VESLKESLKVPLEELPNGFAALGLTTTLPALEQAGFEAPTPIQLRAIPPALQGKDVIGCAATGTGKTAAFLLPIIERLRGKAGTRALVLAPTRELALQIAEELSRFGKHSKIRGAVVIGGVGMGQQVQAFRDHVEVIVATPGRLNDHLQSGTAKLDHVEVLVLDEADRMLDMGFKPQLERILARLPKQRQTMLFSATMAGEVADFARKALKDPVKVEVASSGTTAMRADQQVFLVGQEEKTALLLALLEHDNLSTLVFTRTKRRADRLAKALDKSGHQVAVIHADRSQGQRKRALDDFKADKVRVLVATDIAARGIDVEGIGHVINFDLPQVPEDYVHRIGRTARNQASGRASSFASPEEHDLLRGIEKFTRATVKRTAVPREDAGFQGHVEKAREAKIAAGPERRGRQGGGGGRPGGGGGGRPQGRGGGGGGRSHGRPSSGGGGASAPSGAGAVQVPSSGGPRRLGGTFKPRTRR